MPSHDHCLLAAVEMWADRIAEKADSSRWWEDIDVPEKPREAGARPKPGNLECPECLQVPGKDHEMQASHNVLAATI